MEPNQRIGLEESVNLTDNSNDSNNDQSLNEQLIEISEKYNTLKTEYHKINEELEKTTQELEAAKEEIKKSNDRTSHGKARKKISKLESDKAKQYEEIQILKRKLKETETQCSELLEQNEALKKKLREKATESGQELYKGEQQIVGHEQLISVLLDILSGVTSNSKDMATLKESIADLKLGADQRATKLETDLKEMKTEVTQEIGDLRKDLGKEKQEPPQPTMTCEQVESPQEDTRKLSELSDSVPPETDKSGSLVTGAVNSVPDVMYM